MVRFSTRIVASLEASFAEQLVFRGGCCFGGSCFGLTCHRHRCSQESAAIGISSGSRSSYQLVRCLLSFEPAPPPM